MNDQCYHGAVFGLVARVCPLKCIEAENMRYDIVRPTAATTIGEGKDTGCGRQNMN